MNKECDYCNDGRIVPISCAGKFLKKRINNWFNKKRNYDFNLLKLYVKISSEIEKYIYNEYEDLYKNLGPMYYSSGYGSVIAARNFLWNINSTYISTFIKCDFCNKEACEFHINNGGFVFKCCDADNCSNRYSICGWCQEIIDPFIKDLCRKCAEKKSINKKKLLISSIISNRIKIIVDKNTN